VQTDGRAGERVFEVSRLRFLKKKAAPMPPSYQAVRGDHTVRAIIIFLISAIAFAGFKPFGQVLAQFMIVWQR
jgi:hypothetical protein